VFYSGRIDVKALFSKQIVAFATNYAYYRACCALIEREVILLQCSHKSGRPK